MDIANETIVLLIGLVLGVVLTRANDVLKNLPASAYAYTTLGLLLFLSTLVLGWLGIVAVVVAYLLYQANKGMFAQAIGNALSFSWFKRKKKKPVTDEFREAADIEAETSIAAGGVEVPSKTTADILADRPESDSDFGAGLNAK